MDELTNKLTIIKIAELPATDDEPLSFEAWLEGEPDVIGAGNTLKRAVLDLFDTWAMMETDYDITPGSN